LHDAVALAGAFGPGALLGFGAGEAVACDILAPTDALLSRAEVSAAASLGRPRYFLSFGNFSLDDLASAAGALEHLAAATGAGFIGVCLAAPGRGRTVYQGHLFEGAAMRADLARLFAGLIDGGVGVVPQNIVAGGALAIRAACGKLKEQGKTLALIDAVNDDDCDAVAHAMASMPLAGGTAGFAGAGGVWPEDTQSGPVAILSGARDRQVVFQIGAARAALPVFDLNFAAADPVAEAVGQVANIRAGAFIITSTVPPDKMSGGTDAAGMLGAIACRLAAAGVRRFIIAGGETAVAVRAALGISQLRATAMTGPLLWGQDENFAISFKSPGSGGKNLFLSDFEPHLRLNNIAELTS